MGDEVGMRGSYGFVESYFGDSTWLDYDSAARVTKDTITEEVRYGSLQLFK
jgi:hypothetical protein